jgi:uncharacterized membrane protein
MAAQHDNDTRLADGLGCFSIGLGVAEVAVPGTVAQLIGVPDDSHTRTVLRAYGARKIATGIGILASAPHPAWLWARVAGDVLDLATLGLAMRRGADGTRLTSAMASVAGVMVADVAAARQMRHGRARAHQSDLVWKAFTINRSPDEVAARWADINPLGDIVTSIRFDPAPGEQGTEVRVAFTPGWFGRTSPRNVQEKLRQFKQLLETGEVTRSHGTASGLQPAPAVSDGEREFAGAGGRR